MKKKITTPFTAAADQSADKILDAIRAPEKDFLTAYYVAQRSKDVAEGLLQLANAGETEAVTSFIASDAVRFETLVKNGQLATLMETIEQLNKSQQVKFLSATESYLSGCPNATVLQNIVSSRDEKTIEKFGEILRGFDAQQRIDLFSAPQAAWWVSCYDQTDLLVEILSSLSQNERQCLVNKAGNIASVIQISCSNELNNIFKGCTFPTVRSSEPVV